MQLETPEWIDLFNARKGVICFVGAGGKKTTMFRIAQAHGGRVAITATAHIERFPRRYSATTVVAEGDELYQRVMALGSAPVVAFAHPSNIPGRHSGLADDELLRLYRDGHFDLCVIKADGARGRLIKAPAEHEPPIPGIATTVIPILSARAIGMPLSEKVAHRPERIAAIAGMQPGDVLQPGHIARLLVSEQGALKNTRDAQVVPIINMVDDDEDRERLARQAAEEALAMTNRFDRVLLTAMKQDPPVVAVITR